MVVEPFVTRRRGTAWAVAALVIGLGHFAFSLMWAFGSRILLDTVGGALADRALDDEGLLVVVAGTAAVVKLVAAVLPLAAVRVAVSAASRAERPRPIGQLVRTLGWAEGLILTLYGGVLTVVGLLVQLDVIKASADADHRALAWHAFLWDPWFMVWGVCVILAMALSRYRRPARRSRHGSHADQPTLTSSRSEAPEPGD